MGYVRATPPLIEQWANNLGITTCKYGSWLETIAVVGYNLDPNTSRTGDRLADIAVGLGVNLRLSKGDHYQDIALKIKSTAKPIDGSWLATIVYLTTP